jgi:hypothetical protein
MTEQLELSSTMQDIIEKIIKRLNQDRIELSTLRNPKYMTFVINNSTTSIEEKIRFYDPLYSNNFVRNNINNNINIMIKTEANDEVSRFEREIVIKKAGYAKFKVNNQYYEWRECRAKENQREKVMLVKFNCFENSCKINNF